MSLKFRRMQRLEKELRELVASCLLSSRFKGFLEGLVSISSVKLNSDLRRAKVFVSVLGSSVQTTRSFEEILSREREIQKYVNKSLRMKFPPRLFFVLEEDMGRFTRVEALLYKHHQINGIKKDSSH